MRLSYTLSFEKQLMASLLVSQQVSACNAYQEMAEGYCLQRGQQG